MKTKPGIQKLLKEARQSPRITVIDQGAFGIIIRKGVNGPGVVLWADDTFTRCDVPLELCLTILTVKAVRKIIGLPEQTTFKNRQHI